MQMDETLIIEDFTVNEISLMKDIVEYKKSGAKKADNKEKFFAMQKTKAEKDFDRKESEERLKRLQARSEDVNKNKLNSKSCSSKNIVVKSNSFIGASYEMTLIEQQLILFAITRSREENNGLSITEPVEISAINFANQFGTNVKSVFTQLKKAAYKLKGRYIYAELIDDTTGIVTIREISLLSEIRYTPKLGIVGIVFSPQVIEMIHRVTGDSLNHGFTQYNLDLISGMTSVYAIRIYELIMQNKYTGRSLKLEIEDLRFILQLEHKYKLYNDLKKNVIDIAINQIKEFSNLKEINFKENKIGNKVVSVNFYTR